MPVSKHLISNAPVPLLKPQDYRDVIEQIDQCQYFTNHGPQTQAFEQALQSRLNVQHAIAVGSESLAVLIALAALEVRGHVLLPRFGYVDLPVIQMAELLDLPFTFYDTDWSGRQPDLGQIHAVANEQTDALVIMEPLGRLPVYASIEQRLRRHWKTLLVAPDSLASAVMDSARGMSQHQILATVYSLGPGRAVSSWQGGVITTGDADFANRVRNIRSSYGAGEKVDVEATCNGRFSEIQACLGLKSLARLSEVNSHCQAIVETYRHRLAGVEHIIELYARQDDDLRPNELSSWFPVLISNSIEIPSFDCEELGIRVGPVFPEPCTIQGSQEIGTRHRLLLLPVVQCVDRQAATTIIHRLAELVEVGSAISQEAAIGS